MTVESYMHKYAKTVLASWLRQKVRVGEKYKGLENIPLPVKGKSPMFNVYVEYPVCSFNDELVGVTGNTDSDHPWISWLNKNGKKAKAKHGVPSSFELKDWEKAGCKLKILHVFDVAVIDPETGCLHSVYEIQHKHPVTEYKKKFLEDNDIDGFEISAEWIMNKVKAPFTVECIQTI